MTGPARGLTHHSGPPADAGELAGFPDRTVEGVWFRSHVDRAASPDHGCWWFSSVGAGDPNGYGRFDLPKPDGTCYLGSTEEVAARERIGPYLSSVAGRELVSAAVLSTPDGPVVITQVPLEPTRAANFPVKRAMRWVNRSLAVGTGIYATTQAWAAKLREAGRDGIVYEPRFTGGHFARSLALFGPSGAPEPRPPVGDSRWLGDVLDDIGVEVLPWKPPTASGVLAVGTPPPAL